MVILNESLKAFALLMMMSAILQMVLLSVLNKWRVIKLRRFIDSFKARNVLSEKDHQILNDRYNGIFSGMEFFPDTEDFATLYKDEAFDQFVTKTKKRMKILSIGFAISLALTIIFVPLAEKI